GPAEEQLHRHLQPVIHLDFTAHQRVEMALDELVDEVPGEIHRTSEGRNSAWPPTFVDGLVALGHAHGEGGYLVEKEGIAMVVEDDDRNVWLGVAHPGLAGLVAVKERLPVRRVAQALVERHANGRHVARTHPADDLSHCAAFQVVRRENRRATSRPAPRRSG